MKLKTSFKLLILFFGISILFVNCENEELLIENTKDLTTIEKEDILPNIQVNRVTLKEISNKTSLKESIDKISTAFDVQSKKKNTTINSAIAVESVDGGFTILTDEIVEIITETTETYTFRIEEPTEETSVFENFVIEKKENDQYSFYIYRYINDENGEYPEFKYSLSRQEVDEQQVNIGNFDDIINNVIHYDATSDCYYEYRDDYLYIISCGGGSEGSTATVGGSVGGYQGDYGGGGNTGGPGTGGTGSSTGGTGDSSTYIFPLPGPTNAETLAALLGVVLTEEQIAWANSSGEWWGSGNYEDVNQLIDYLESCQMDSSQNIIAVDCDSVVEFGKLAMEANIKSPFKVDLFEFAPNNNIILPEENKKFMCIYNALANSPKFKSLFVDTFGVDDSNMKIKFEIDDLLQPNGFIPEGKTIANNLDVTEQTIKLDREFLSTNHPLNVAQTIIHEALHAFINVKQVECISNPNSTSTYDLINSLNQLTFDELLNDFTLDCDVNQPVQHRLMYNRMVNAMDEMLAEVFEDLVATEDQDLTGNPIYMYPPPNGDQHVFNWVDAFHYLNLAGLKEAKEFKEDNLQDPSISYLISEYKFHLNDSPRFNHSTCSN